MYTTFSYRLPNRTKENWLALSKIKREEKKHEKYAPIFLMLNHIQNLKLFDATATAIAVALHRLKKKKKKLHEAFHPFLMLLLAFVFVVLRFVYRRKCHENEKVHNNDLRMREKCVQLYKQETRRKLSRALKFKFKIINTFQRVERLDMKKMFN